MRVIHLTYEEFDVGYGEEFGMMAKLVFDGRGHEFKAGYYHI